jgi:hypothetical protein
MIGVRDAQIRPLDGDAEYRSIGKLQQDPLGSFTGTAIEERESLPPQGVERMSDEHAGIRRMACSLLGW